MESYFLLAEHFRTQDDPSFCGLASLALALNALSVDPGRVWKGVWRWYHESMLDCCVSLEDVRRVGVSLDQLACLARCNGADVKWLQRAPPLSADANSALSDDEAASLAQFRADVLRSARQIDGHRTVLVVSYSRRTLAQTGDGHFSPIAGAHEARDLALIMDVAAFKYPPHWVPIPLLWQAMRSEDPTTGRPRGWIVLRHARDSVSASFPSLFTIDAKSWESARSFLLGALPEAVRAALTDLQQVCASSSGSSSDSNSGSRDAVTVHVLRSLLAVLSPSLTNANPNPADADASAAEMKPSSSLDGGCGPTSCIGCRLLHPSLDVRCTIGASLKSESARLPELAQLLSEIHACSLYAHVEQALASLTSTSIESSAEVFTVVLLALPEASIPASFLECPCGLAELRKHRAIVSDAEVPAADAAATTTSTDATIGPHLASQVRALREKFNMILHLGDSPRALADAQVSQQALQSASAIAGGMCKPACRCG